LANVEIVREIYELARRGNHRELRTRLSDDATWHPVHDDAWKACTTADEVVKTMLWRSQANRLRPGDMLELGGLVFVQLRGKRLERLGAKGLVPKLFQVIAVREGKVVSIHDYARRNEALEAAGVKPL